MARLTPKRRRFVEEYLTDMDAANAARRAGYSDRTAPQIGYQLLQDDEVKQLIEEGLRARRFRLQMQADEVIERLTTIARAQTTDYVSWGEGQGVRLRDSDLLTAEQSYCVSEVRQTEQGLRFKLEDRVAALRDLGRHLGLFTDRTEHTFPQGLPVTPEQAAQARREVEEYRRQRLQGTHANGHERNGTARPR